MPLSAKGKKIKAKLIAEYGKKKGEEVFYAMENKGASKGLAKPSRRIHGGRGRG